MPFDNLYTLIIIVAGGILCLGVLMIVGLGIFLIIRANINRSKVLNSNWERFARNKGLTFVKGGYPRLSGPYRGREVKLAVINPDYDFEGHVQITAGTTTSSNVLVTRASASVKDNGLKLKVYEKGRYFRDAGEQPPVVGNEMFDAKFMISCSSPDEVKSILRPEIQSSLLEYRIKSLDLQQDTVKLDVVGVESRLEILEAYLELVCRIADEIENR